MGMVMGAMVVIMVEVGEEGALEVEENGNNGRGGYGNTGGNGNTEGQNRNQYQSRGPNCFHCVRLKKERTDHWPQNCQTLKADLDEYHKIQSEHGHQDKHLNT